MAVYLDHNASHPLLPLVREKLAEAIFNEDPSLGNPASIHRKGQRAKKMVSDLRLLLSEFLGRGDGDEFVFTSGATEAINLALRGFVDELELQQKPVSILSTQVEHSAVIDTLNDLAKKKQSLNIDYLSVNSRGAIDSAPLQQKVTEKISEGRDVLLVLQLVNNETGVFLNLPELLAPLFQEFGPSPVFSKLAGSASKNKKIKNNRLWVLVDAAQALGKVPESYIRQVLHFADYMTLSAHKMGGPQGIGALWLRADAPLKAQVTGGNQERKRRAGTFNSLGALGWKFALNDWKSLGDSYRARLLEMREYVRRELQKIKGLEIHGDWSDGARFQLCNTLNFHVEGCPEESLLLAMDLEGFELASGSACNSGSLKPSKVLLAMGYPETVALSSLRLSLGIENTPNQLENFVEVLAKKIEHIRQSREEAKRILPHLETEMGVL